ncbi:hypothetical protein [Streptomyces rapamycinicus]|nr:hypothetical protein [Streptomyces rapamycinicus]MBB4779098.1 Kef-type K+ transport system membrane component KefB [Streptomyces rapamycinicus]UTP27922.1 hypothetical protein LIV37_00065 [Streptomyces rapamycinicus NRRL 5491]
MADVEDVDAHRPLVACTGKFVGAAMSARLSGVSGSEPVVLGVLLNARGLTELVILNVGLELGVPESGLLYGYGRTVRPRPVRNGGSR